MIQLAAALPTATIGPVKPNAAIAADVSGFALALGALMPRIAAPVAAPQGKPGDVAILLPGRQDVAEGGKELPDAVLGLEGRSEEQAGADTDSDDRDASTEDAPPPPFAWFATAPAPVAEPEVKADAALAVTVDPGGKRGTQPEAALPEVALPETVDASAATVKAEAPTPKVTLPTAPEAKRVEANSATTTSRTPRADAAVPPAPAPATTTVPAPAPRTAPADPAVEAAMAQAVTTTTAEAPTDVEPAASAPLPHAPHAPRELRQAAAEAPVVRIALDRPAMPQKLSIADVAPQATPIASPSVADQIFAAFDRLRGQAGATDPSDSQAALSTLAAPTTGTQTLSAVAAAGQAQDAPLDTRHQEWTAKMIDKIEMLQGGPVREAKISLMPEGLGKVDIAIRQDDAGLHVQFSTDTPSARQLIADAQPKLAEIAQERGIRIGSTSVDTNGGGNGTGTGNGSGANTANSQMNQGQRQDAQPWRNQPSAPLPGQRREASSSTSQDERVA